MANLKIDLEKRIFVMFFVITFMLVFTLILIEYQLVRFGIRQNEDININGALTEYQVKRAELNNQTIQDMQIIATKPEMLQIFNQNQYNQIPEFLNSLDISINKKNMIILTKEKTIVYGESWVLIDTYIDDIFEKYASSFHGQFYAAFGQKAYSIFYIPIYIEDNFEGLIIYNEEFFQSKLSLESNLMGFIATVDLDSESILYIKKPWQDREVIAPIIARYFDDNVRSKIIRYKSDTAYGIVYDFDINSEPSVLYILPYTRDVYMFAQQSVLFFTLILLAVTIIMISLLGNWFSRAILAPVQEVSKKMDVIANDPMKIDLIKKEYVGVLGSMVDTFNSMNKSVTKYSMNLHEYKTISDNTDSGFFWLDRDFKIKMCNNSLPKIFDCNDAKELIGKNINYYLDLKTGQLRAAQSDGLTLPQLEIFSGAAKKFILLNIMPVKSKSEISFVGTITDISSEVNERLARESLEMELIKSNRLAEIGRRIEGIVHNINSPLNTILGYAQLMRKNMQDSRDLEKIIEAGKNISHLVKGLLNKAKADSSSMVRPLDINELIHQELELCNHNLFFKHYVDLELDLAENLPAVKAVYSDVSLCIANVINNAIESLENRIDKFIKVKTYMQDELLAISIEDTGQGIPEENRAAIFEPYFTTKAKEGGKGSGFGLGLAISKNVVDKYEGRIELYSEINKGSKFIILLPVM